MRFGTVWGVRGGGWKGGCLVPTAVMQTHVAGLLHATSGSYCVWLLELLKFSSPP